MLYFVSQYINRVVFLQNETFKTAQVVLLYIILVRAWEDLIEPIHKDLCKILYPIILHNNEINVF